MQLIASTNGVLESSRLFLRIVTVEYMTESTANALHKSVMCDNLLACVSSHKQGVQYLNTSFTSPPKPVHITVVQSHDIV